MAWKPDPRTCRNCDGLGSILNFDAGDADPCDDCDGTGTEYLNDSGEPVVEGP